MPCYFVSSGVEIPMTNETFDLIWNGFGNKAGGRILQQKTERRKIFPKILPRENEATLCM